MASVLGDDVVVILGKHLAVVTCSFCQSSAGSISPSNMYSSRVSTRLRPVHGANRNQDISQKIRQRAYIMVETGNAYFRNLLVEAKVTAK